MDLDAATVAIAKHLESGKPVDAEYAAELLSEAKRLNGEVLRLGDKLTSYATRADVEGHALDESKSDALTEASALLRHVAAQLEEDDSALATVLESAARRYDNLADE